METKTNYVSLSIDNFPEDKIPYLVAFALGLDQPFTLHVSDSIPDEPDDISTQVTNNFIIEPNKKEQ